MSNRMIIIILIAAWSNIIIDKINIPNNNTKTINIDVNNIDINNPNDMNNVFELINNKWTTNKTYVTAVVIEVILKQNQEIINKLDKLEKITAEIEE